MCFKASLKKHTNQMMNKSTVLISLVIILLLGLMNCNLSNAGKAMVNADSDLLLTENIKHPDPLIVAFEKAVNQGEVEPFRRLFSPKMKGRNSAEKLRQRFGQLVAQVGSIKRLTLDQASDHTSSYISFHEKMISLRITFTMDENGLLDSMLIDSQTVNKDAPTLARNKTSFILPFQEEWYVFWGGKKTSDNYHNAHTNMKGAYDFWVMGKNGKSHHKNATRNEDFYAFGKPIISPVDAKVIFVYDQIADNQWPAMNPQAGYGNAVLLETVAKEYVLLAHLKQYSVTVKVGQEVRQGELLGLCGNSGNSTEPHLHFQLQNIPDFSAATGAWIYFDQIEVNGILREGYLPKRGEKVRNRNTN